jgi:3-dehydroquinate dehydratase-2
MTKILLINGPNLQLLGVREPGIYGVKTLPEIVADLREYAVELGCELEDFQSNSEGALVDKIGGSLAAGVDGIIINPAAYTHTSVAIRDAIAAVALPAVEVHISNVNSREDFRHVSYTAPVCIGVIAGFGANSYLLALRALCTHIAKKQEN